MTTKTIKVKVKSEKIAKHEDREGLVKIVLDNMAENGLSLRKSCLAAGIGASTFLDWVKQDIALSEHYTRARDAMLDKLADETMEIADMEIVPTGDGKLDSAMVQKQRLQIDTRKWLLSKLAPKRYGDKLELSGDAENPLMIQKIERVIVSE